MKEMIMLNNIAHLPLPVYYDIEKLKKEILSIPYDFHYYQSSLSNGVIMDLFDNRVWESLALISLDGKMIPNPAEEWVGDFKETELKEICPYTYQIINDFGGGKLLARIEKLMPKIGTVGWHSHILEARQPDWISVIQIPVSIPKESKHSVISYMDYRGSTYKKPLKVYEECYKEGQLYVLNSYHYHNAFNYSDEPMYIIRFYVDSREPKIKEIFDESIKNYKGEYIPFYQDWIDEIEKTEQIDATPLCDIRAYSSQLADKGVLKLF
jgi:hypothetical protein